MKTLLALTTTVLSLAVLTGCKKETYGDPMKFAQKYLLDEIMSPGYKITDTTDPSEKSMTLKELMKMRGYTGFEVLNARLSSTPYGEEVVECTVGIKTSGEYEYYYWEESVYPSKVGAWNGIHAFPEKGEENEEWVSRLRSINDETLRYFKPISTPLSFRAHTVRRQVDGVYIPVVPYEKRKNRGYGKEEDVNQMWCFAFDEKMQCFSTLFFATSFATSEEMKTTKKYVISGTTEQIQGYNTYSQRVGQAKLLSDGIRKKQARLRNINDTLENRGWRRVEGEERIKLEKEQKEVMQTLGELKKQVLTL